MTLLGGEGSLRGSRWLQVPAILLLVLATLPVPGLAWGDRGHKLINAAAVENLPEPLRSYFRGRKAYLIPISWRPMMPRSAHIITPTLTPMTLSRFSNCAGNS